MGRRAKRGLPKRHLWVCSGFLLTLLGLGMFGQGCADMDRFVRESQREYEFKQQMKWAEKELRKGNLVSARSVFEWIRKESNRTDLQQRARFFSAFTTVLDKRDKNRWERGQEMFLRTSEDFPEGDLGQISAHVAATLSDVLDILSAKQVLEEENLAMRREIDLVKATVRKMEALLKKQKKQLSEKKDEIRALKGSIGRRDKEIKSLELKIKKLEEIHKEIKEKREGLG